MFMCGLSPSCRNYGHRYVCAADVEWTKPELTKGPAEMVFPAADGQCLESPFSNCSDLSTDLTVFGEWKPLVSPVSCCGSAPAVGWCLAPPVSLLCLATIVFEGGFKRLSASGSFSIGSSSPGELG